MITGGIKDAMLYGNEKLEEWEDHCDIIEINADQLVIIDLVKKEWAADLFSKTIN
jgi:hypothetical protein